MPAAGQPLVPLADNVTEPLMPTGISQMPARLNAKLVYVFEDAGGTSALHFIGDFTLTLGEENRPSLASREAVVWLHERDDNGKPYRHLEVLLWREAQIRELAGTTVNGPTLFVSLSTFGEVRVEADDVALQAPKDHLIHTQGNRIRELITEGSPRAKDEQVAFRIMDVSGLSMDKKDEPGVRPVIHFQSPGAFTVSHDTDGRQIITVTGGVYLARGIPGTDEYFEMQADAAVVFMPPDANMTGLDTGSEAGLGADRSPQAPADVEATGRRSADPNRQMMASGVGEVQVEAAYLEGDVVMSQGANVMRASRLYYDFQRERAVILDAVVRTAIVERNVPLYVRAAQIRQLSQRELVAENAVLSTSEFHTPHYSVGASRLELKDLTPAEPGGRQTGLRAGSFRVHHATFNIGNTPVLYWPYMRGSIDSSETAVRSLRGGFSNDYGVEIETRWYLFNLLGLETPEGFDATLRLDYLTKRGPGIGVDSDYERDRYFGEFKSYLMTDNDEDDLGRERETLPSQDLRGRFLLRHRQFLEEDWQLTLETAYISDRGFLEEFFKTEFHTGKEQETLLHLKKQRDNWAFTGMIQYRLMDFFTQTERLPDFSLFLLGEPLGTRLTWHSENRWGAVRFRPADQTLRELLRDGRQPPGSGTVFRADTRQEFGAPFDLGAWRMVPFASVRGTAWDDSPRDGGLTRAFGTAGVRGSMYLWKLYPEVRSELFDIDGIRHIIKPDFVAWAAATNVDRDRLHPFDRHVEGIADTDGVTMGLRQRWQTRRGRDETRRIVDLVTWDLEAGFFNNADGDYFTNGYTSYSRPENSISHNYINSSLIWRINDRTALVSEMNYDINDGEVDVLNVSLAVERPPRFSYLIGYRFIEESESNLLGLDLNYRLNEKHTLALRESFDLDRGRTLEFTLALIRKFPRWFGALSFALNEAEDDFGVSLSVWPEGLPQAALGSRRFTGLSETTRIIHD